GPTILDGLLQALPADRGAAGRHRRTRRPEHIRRPGISVHRDHARHPAAADLPGGGCGGGTGASMRTPLADAHAAAQRAKSSWKLPAGYWSVFSSGLYIGNKIDFVRWRLITKSILL